MTTPDGVELTIHFGRSVGNRLRAAAQRRGVGVDQYCTDAIERELMRDETDTQEPTGKPYDFDSLFAFCDQLLGGRRFSKTGLEYLHDAREIRAKQMKEW